MADCAVIPLRAHLQMEGIRSKSILFVPKKAYARIPQRNYLFMKSNLVSQFKPPKVLVNGASFRIALEGSQCMKESFFKCCCFGSLTDPESAVPSNWMSVVDQMLLMVSIVFAHLAGAIPRSRAYIGVKNNTTSQHHDAARSTNYGRSTESNMNGPWIEVKEKLMDALTAIENDGRMENRAAEHENESKMHSLNIFAVDEGPRLRLLWVTLQQLQKEVGHISQTQESVSRDIWLLVALEVIKGATQPIYIKWLEEELTLEIGQPEMKLTDRMLGKLNGDDRILQNISRSGKAELYADLLFFLRFGSLRNGCCYDNKLLTRHGVDILEDLVILLADEIASIYLELISIDSDMSNEINGLGLTLCSLSTRSLQRLRNEVVLNQWLQQNFKSVVTMYEDRFELFVFSRKQLEDSVESRNEKIIWWKKFAFSKSTRSSSLHHVQINLISLLVKRTKELRALTGWRYYFSLYLELLDITMPFASAVFTKIRGAVSFFLMCMIGRSLGLIFNGIRQSLGWR
ncbi:uncharacterized protein [Elaeis guineensis]|uniref:Uncharacterized protein LOC105055724 isoform X1 n=1 Tax=Elaeis guineensis var. tenera TaxID=51953 RepID=A0A6I9S1D3_ELAGV|nr:uncharacterized protein LOC105055724 isoform X1 [Elaeis guineensis]XP_029123586.1 uncharacterized protein LOC105055724 isoform X1 [Elaeis guineensis]